MSYLENLKNYSHCPLKKRPLHFIKEEMGSDDNNQPQDLRVKRRKECDKIQTQTTSERLSHPVPGTTTLFPSPQPTPSTTPSAALPTYSTPPVSLENVQKTLQSSSKAKLEPRIPPLADFYLQLFQQSTAYHHKQPKMSPWDGAWPILPSGRSWNPIPQALSTPASGPTSPPAESHLSSPRSTSSEDSGMGSEFVVSEDEIDVQRESSTRAFHRHSCESCGKSYSTQSGLRKHNELHCSSLGPRAFACKHCAKAYTSIGALKMHIRTHTLPCKCQVCGKAFSRPWLLQGHIRTHTGEKPFQCLQCHRSFADRSNLRAHQQTHERVKKYACQSCKKTFSRMSLLNKHSENACPGTVISGETN